MQRWEEVDHRGPEVSLQQDAASRWRLSRVLRVWVPAWRRLRARDAWRPPPGMGDSFKLLKVWVQRSQI